MLTPNDFDDLDVVRTRLPAFEIRYNQNARPDEWKFTTVDLNELLTRLDRHPPPTAEPAQARAA